MNVGSIRISIMIKCSHMKESSKQANSTERERYRSTTISITMAILRTERWKGLDSSSYKKEFSKANSKIISSKDRANFRSLNLKEAPFKESSKTNSTPKRRKES